MHFVSAAYGGQATSDCRKQTGMRVLAWSRKQLSLIQVCDMVPIPEGGRIISPGTNRGSFYRRQ